MTVSREVTVRGAAEPTPGLIDDVRSGLSGSGQKSLPSKYLYDEAGSALFEAITFLDAYGLTRADERILSDHAEAIARAAGGPPLVAELGSGSGRKVRGLLRALGAAAETTYCPIDISRQAITYCRAELGRIPRVRFHGIVAEYLAGLRRVTARRPKRAALLVLFVGSTIGNFEREPALRFLRGVRALLAAGDRVLLGTDLVKPEAQLLLAYDDPAGVTAAFNRNVLSRLNRELGADFDLERFVHEARWNRSMRRVEMHLRSTSDQTVRVPAAGFEIRLRRSETIWTESSHKFRPEEPGAMGLETGFRTIGQWIDEEWPFAETMLEAR
jgi:dimethylhistidine N-methyltransferase